MDDNRELRAMLFSVIHIPPLPSIVSRLDREDYSIVDDSAVADVIVTGAVCV